MTVYHTIRKINTYVKAPVLFPKHLIPVPAWLSGAGREKQSCGMLKEFRKKILVTQPVLSVGPLRFYHNWVGHGRATGTDSEGCKIDCTSAGHPWK